MAKAADGRPFATDVSGDHCWTHRTTADGGAEAFRFTASDRVLAAPTGDLNIARDITGKSVIEVTVMPMAKWVPELIKTLDEELAR